MHRQPLLRLLQNHVPFDANEAHMRADVIDFVTQYPTCFERSLAVGHVTASAWIMNKRGTHALMTHHRKLDRWLQLGGHADGETDVRKVALQEATEESGLLALGLAQEGIFDVDVHLIPAYGALAAHYHYDIRFLLQADDTQPLTRAERESKQLRWIPLAEITLLNTDESIQRMVRKTQQMNWPV